MSVRWVLVLSENWTMRSGGSAADLRTMVRWAQEAEDAGIDAVMVSEHVVLGSSAGDQGRMANPREYALPGNQDPDMPWPSSLLMLSAMAAVTQRVRLAACAVISPLRHPLLLAKDFATLDALSGGRLVVQPTVSWHSDEYAALGVPFGERGARLDEQLAVWDGVWKAAATGSPSRHEGRFWSFDDVWVSPAPPRPEGPALWFGGQTLHGALVRRLTRHGSGWHPLGRPSDADRATFAAALGEAGRAPSDLELVGGVRARFPADDAVASLPAALEQVPGLVADGFTTLCVKPGQYTDDADGLPAFCRELVSRTEALLS
jgi:alkanesulfonate monooxygenase SsuD/methylene tetrahydromethanopterin reductase-like flavin-dependent oxidoreductase (luciferase family)